MCAPLLVRVTKSCAKGSRTPLRSNLPANRLEFADDCPPQKPSWSARIPLFVGFLGVAILVGGFGSWATLTKIAGAIVASGRIEVAQNRQVVQHPYGGVVADILVQEGDAVTAEQVLIKLDPVEWQSKKAILESELFELMARQGRLIAERDGTSEIKFPEELHTRAATDPDVRELMEGQTNLLRARDETISRETEQLSRQREQLNNQIEGIDAQAAAMEIQRDLIAEELASQQELLDKGWRRLLASWRFSASKPGWPARLAN